MARGADFRRRRSPQSGLKDEMRPQISQMTQIKEEFEEKDPRTYAIIGAAMEVHRALGQGFLEAVYHEALTFELTAQGIPFRREAAVPIFYRGKLLSVSYRADLLCFESVIVELKALPKITGVEESQLLNYLKAANLETGLLLNFGTKSLEWQRMIRTPRVAE
jgi:GxxExxY protein